MAANAVATTVVTAEVRIAAAWVVIAAVAAEVLEVVVVVFEVAVAGAEGPRRTALLQEVRLIHTGLQPGVRGLTLLGNRFNGFHCAVELLRQAMQVVSVLRDRKTICDRH